MKTKNHITCLSRSWLGGVCLMMALAGCSSSKHVARATDTERAEAAAEVSESAEAALVRSAVTRLTEESADYEAVTSKVNLTLKLSGKDPVKLGGTLRIRRGQVVQLSVTYLLGIEVGRLEIAPEGVKVIDRVNKRYVEVSFSELSSMAHADLNYYSLQALFLNELFLPGKETVSAADLSLFDATLLGSEAILQAKDTDRFLYRFLANVEKPWLKESRIALVGSDYVLRWQYSDFRSLLEGVFPALMQVDFEGSSKPVSLTMELSRLSTDTNWETHTQLSSKYERVEWQDILSQIMKL